MSSSSALHRSSLGKTARSLRPFVHCDSSPREAPAQSPSPSSSPKLRLLTSLSRAVEVQSTTLRFEQLAGRSAMLGTTTALCLELIRDGQPLLQQSTYSTAALASAGLVVMALAASLAAVQYRSTLSAPLLEAVISSLTAAKRSAASVSGSQVDSLVDYVVAKTFSMEVMRDLTDYNDLDVGSDASMSD
ncbi:hypothetical protein V8C86DRAFT_2780462 [Haematococcus lacustris]